MQDKKRKRIAIPIVAIFIATFLIAGAASVFAAVDDHTVQGKNPQGTVISLFDYWVNEQGSSDFSATPDLNSGINKNRDLKFNKGQGDGFNGWTGSKAPYSGMVKNTLNSNGYPDLATSWTNGIFYPSPLDYLFNENDSTTEGSAKVEGKKAYTNVDGLMQVDDDGYYYYDSTKNFASYDSSSNSVKLYEKPGVYYRGTPGQFFPFNSGSDVFSESNGAISAKTSVNAESNNVNHWFGASMSTHFMHPEGGKTTRNQDITYEFSGDDDVWVFIDDVLVGDLGGIHDAASLKINFSTGAVSINGQSDGTLKSKYEAAGKAGETTWKGNTYAGGTYHTLKFFYLERGNYASNMSLKFNLKLMPDNELNKIDQYGNAVEGAGFDLYPAERTETDGKVSYKVSGASLCSGSTNANGNLILKAADGATINFEELYKKGTGAYYILRETTVPDGYRRSKDVWLQYDSKTGAITTENKWESGVSANSRIMITAPTRIYDRNQNLIEMEDGILKQGSIFAVVCKRTGDDIGADSSWASISGSVLDGWRLTPLDDDGALADVLKGNKYELKPNSMGAYETTLSELPGDIMTYSNVIVADNKGKSGTELYKALQDKARYSISYYYTTGAVEDANASNTERLDTGITTTNPNAKEFDYQYALKITATDVTNDLYVQKSGSDMAMTPLNGVKFALYPESEIDTLSSVLSGDPVLKTDAKPVQEQTTATINDGTFGEQSGTAAFRKLKKGTYYLREVSAPNGFSVKNDLVKVVVTDEGAYADAGKLQDNIYSLRAGTGTLLKGMEQYAINNDIDQTLTEMKASLRISSKEPAEDGSWDESASSISDDSMHLRYVSGSDEHPRGQYKVVYGSDLYDLFTDLQFFAADKGWPSIVLQQWTDEDDQKRGEDLPLTANKYADKTDLGDMNLSHLFVMETMVKMFDEPVGDLEISKTVENDSSETDFSDKDFTFKVKLWDEDEEMGDEESVPVSGTFKYVVKGPGASDSEEKELVVNEEGNGQLQLKHGQTAVIRDLPAGTQYQVTEDLGEETYWDVKSSVDGSEGAESTVVQGTIPQPDQDANKQKSTVTYENTYSPAAVTLDIPVEKLFNGWNLASFEGQKFDIRLTGLASTGDAIQNTMPDAQQNPQDGTWFATKQIDKGEHTASNEDIEVEEMVSSSTIFEDLNFTKTGTYAYTVKEIQGAHQDINYSSAIYEVLVTVEDDPDTGKLAASYIMKKTIDDDGTSLEDKPETADTAVFENIYNSKTEVTNFIIHKTYSNATGSDVLADNQFQFQLEAVTADAPMPEDARDGKITAPSTPGGRISFPDITYETADQGKTYVYKVSEVIPEGADKDQKLAGTQYDADVYYIQVKVLGTGGAQVRSEIRYFLDENCMQEIVQDQDTDHLYEIEDGVYRLWFHNSYTAEPAKVSVQGGKTLKDRDMADGEFGFTLEGANGTTKEALKDGSILGAADGRLTASSAAAKAGVESGFAFPELAFNHVGTYTFNVKEIMPDEAKDSRLDGVTYDDNITTVTVKVTDKDTNGNKTGKLKAEVSYINNRHEAADKAKFVNSYEESGSCAITGTKNITGRDFAEGDSYTFTVTPQKDAPYPTDKDGKDIKEVTVTPKSGDSAKIDFGTVGFDQADVSYKYTLKEKQPASGEDTKGVSYDDTTYTLTLTSRSNDPKNGQLVIDQELTADDQKVDSIAWINVYSPAGSMELKGTKTLTGRKWRDGDEFTFTLWAKADDEALLSAVKDSYTIDDDGRAIFKSVTVDEEDAGNDQTVTLDFGKLNFTKGSDGKPYEFYITETMPGREEIRGIKYDGSDHRIPVYVTDDGQGNLTAEVAENSITNLDFYNVYSSSIVYSNEAGIVIEKTLNGHDMSSGQFEFTVEALDSGSGDAAVTAEQAAARIGFGQGELKRTYQSAAALDGQKSTIDILNGKKVSFNQDDAGKTFSYKVTETKGGAAGYKNDASEYRVDIILSDDGEGVLTAETKVTKLSAKKTVSHVAVHSNDDPAQDKTLAVVPFTNSYSASGTLGGSGSAKIKADKTLTGRAMKAGEFKFNVTNAKDTAEQKTIIASGTNKAAADGKAGDVDFAEIKYTTAKLKSDVADGLAVKKDGKYIYQYVVAEETGDLPAGVSPIEAAFSVTVTVTDNGDGTLTAQVGYPDGTDRLSFSNEYDISQISVPVKGLKSLNTVNGAGLTIKDIEGKYDFALTGKETTGGTEKDAPLPSLNGKKMTKASNDATGEIDFGHITLEASDFDGITPDDQGVRTRTFEYRITESGSVSGVVNDSEQTKTLKMTVAYNSREKSFDVKGLPEEAAFRFVNTYGIEPASVEASTLFTVNKKLAGRDLKAGEFQFELLEVSADGQAETIATGTNEAAAADEAASVDFGRITYDRPGEHDYLIREMVPDGGVDLNTVYDTKTYSVHVSVTDQKDGTLKAAVSGESDGTFTFHNKQLKKPGSNGGGQSGDNGGIGGRGTKTGDTTPPGLAILLMLAAVCTGILVLGLRREQVK